VRKMRDTTRTTGCSNRERAADEVLRLSGQRAHRDASMGQYSGRSSTYVNWAFESFLVINNALCRGSSLHIEICRATPGEGHAITRPDVRVTG
jgi:hypothetical protein